MYPPVPGSCGGTFNTNKIVTTVLKENANTTSQVSGPVFHGCLYQNKNKTDSPKPSRDIAYKKTCGLASQKQ